MCQQVVFKKRTKFFVLTFLCHQVKILEFLPMRMKFRTIIYTYQIYFFIRSHFENMGISEWYDAKRTLHFNLVTSRMESSNLHERYLGSGKVGTL